MEEKSFFTQGGVSVTNARFIAHGQTYAMSGVTSVKQFRQDPSRKGPIILGVIGLLAMAGGGKAVFVALLLLAGAVAWWLSQKPEFSVLLSSASGEAKALTSRDGKFISDVVNALNDAIVHRG
jgi:proline racemase